MLSVDIKQKILENHKPAIQVTNLVCEYNCNASTIYTILLKQKDLSKVINPSKGITPKN